MTPAKEFHADVMRVVEVLMVGDPAPDTTEGKTLIGLASAVEKYEKATIALPELGLRGVSDMIENQQDLSSADRDAIQRAVDAAPAEGPTPPSCRPAAEQGTADLIHLYGEIAGRYAHWKTEVLHDRYMEIRGELLNRFAGAVSATTLRPVASRYALKTPDGHEVGFGYSDDPERGEEKLYAAPVSTRQDSQSLPQSKEEWKGPYVQPNSSGQTPAKLSIQHDMARILQTACDADEADPRALLSEIVKIASAHPWPTTPRSATQERKP